MQTINTGGTDVVMLAEGDINKPELRAAAAVKLTEGATVTAQGFSAHKEGSEIVVLAAGEEMRTGRAANVVIDVIAQYKTKDRVFAVLQS